MKVKIGNRIYSMGRKQFLKMLEGVAKPQVQMGVYAVEKKNYAELRCDKCTSRTQLKKMIRGYKKQGFKVYANGKD